MLRVAARACVALVLAVVLSGHDAVARERPPTPPIALERGPDPRWVQGQITVSAPPEEVWARLQRVDAWPRFFTDIKRLKVVEHRGSHWEIDLETHTLPRGSLRYHVDFEQGRRMRLWRTGMGVAVQAYALVRDGPTPNQSNVVYSLYMRLSGVPRLLISDESLREKQEHMVTVTLRDLYRAY